MSESIYFSAFRLDLRNEQLWRGAELLSLRPKPFAVLRYLADNPGRIIPRAELIKAVWPPDFGATIHGGRLPIVGRQSERQQLRHWLQRATAGERQMIFVSGEAGIGKTTLVDAFSAEAGSAVWIGRGQCIEHSGIGEAYLPVLEALGRLGQESARDHLTAALYRYAPTWLIQLPALLQPTERDGLQREVQGTARERMLRELSDALEALTNADSERDESPPLVLVLEDLQWSDHATLDWLRALAGRRAPARLLVIGTCRLADAIASGHPLKSLIQDLRLRGQCAELALAPLGEDAIAEYVSARLPGDGPQAASLQPLAELLYARTDGNPLFMVNVVEELLARGLVREQGGHWELSTARIEIERLVPESLRQMIEQQLERLSPADQRLVEAGSVAGRTFGVAIVAGSLSADEEEVEDRCAALARQGQLLRARGVREFPDGTVTARYEFVHALHQRVVYDRLTLGRCQRLHLEIGEQKERLWGPCVGEIASELALHFERGRDVSRAVGYRQQAAETAFRRHAYQEAIEHLRAGLRLLETLPDSPARAPRELALLALLGPVLIASKSWGAAAVEATYARARELCRQLGDPPEVFPVLWGAYAVHTGRAELSTAHAIAEEILALAERARDNGLLMKAHEALALVAFIRGDLPVARQCYEKALALYDRQKPHDLVSLSGPGDCGVSCLTRLGMVLALMGFAEQGRQRNREAITLAERLGDSLSLATAVLQAGLMAYALRDPTATRVYAERDVRISQECSLPAFLGLGLALRGWVLSQEGEAAEGIGQIHEGRDQWQAEVAEMVIFGPPMQALLAGACSRAGRITEGLQAVADGLAVVEHSGQRQLEAEFWRLKGELTLRQSRGPDGPSSSRRRRQLEEEAESYFHRAIAVARRQEAKLLELRATVSLVRVRLRQRKTAEDRQRLSEIYAWFTEGAETADLQEAKALLEELG